ncbi:glycosyltransferase family 4 protein [Paenibacillus chitinolyticus]|uniref:glycosyltransferase family 4 protein n=1 Tax=Paenibacillus chitinolyticus TaxID=79263 RepID=UPI003D050AA4
MNKTSDKPLIVLVFTVPESIIFVKGQITYLKEQGWEVAIICSPGQVETEGAKFYPVSMKRDISLVSDLHSLLNLIKLFIKIKPTLINAGTPKAGLLAGVAAFLCRIPNRIYTSHGLRLETLQGVKKTILKWTERVSCFTAHKVICVSPSLRDKLVELRIATKENTVVFNHGSCNGIDYKKYEISHEVVKEMEQIKMELQLPQNAFILGFVGRHTKDKGIEELVGAYVQLQSLYPQLFLLLCGEFEEGDPVSWEIQKTIRNHKQIIRVGHVRNVNPYYQMMDVVILPSYREGMGNVILEASAAAKPVIATNATGCKDAVVEGETGLLVAPGNTSELRNAIEFLYLNPEKAKKMGQLGKERIKRDFKPGDIWKAHNEFYSNMIGHNKNKRLQKNTLSSVDQ